MPERDWCAESKGKLPHLFFHGKTAALVPEFAVEDLPSVELQPWILRLQGQNTLMMMVPKYKIADNEINF